MILKNKKKYNNFNKPLFGRENKLNNFNKNKH